MLVLEEKEYSIPEAAKALGISESTLYRQMRKGEIEPTKILNNTFFTKAVLLEFLKNRSKNVSEEKLIKYMENNLKG